MQLSEQELVRREKLAKLRQLGINPYPADLYPVNHSSKDIKEQFEEGKKDNLFGRFGTVEDIANAVMFYSSDLSSYISGTTLYVDGCEHLAGDRMGLLKTLNSMIKS